MARRHLLRLKAPTFPVPPIALCDDGAMPTTRPVRLRTSQLIWLVAIVAVGVIVGVTAGPWWGAGAAVVLLAISEVIERVRRARS